MGGLKKLFISAATMIKSAFASIIPMAIIGVLTNFVMKLVEARREAQRIKNIFSDYKDSLANSGSTAEIEKIKALHRAVQARLGTEEQIKSAQLELNRLLGIEEGKQVDINAKVAERVKLLEAAARLDQAIESKLNAERSIREIGSKVGVKDNDFDRTVTRTAKALNSPVQGTALGLKGESAKLLTSELVEQMRVYGDAQKTIDLYTSQELGGGGSGGSGGSGSAGGGGGSTEKVKADKNAPDDIKRQSGWWELLKYIEANKPKLGTVQDKGVSMFSKQQRDTTFDYKKSDTEKLEEEYNLLQDYINNLREEGKTAIEQIYLEEQNLTSLSDALKLSQLKEDIEGLRLDIFDESIDGITGFANNLDRVAKSWSRIANEDMSGFEKMVSIINALGDTIGAIVDTWQSYLSLKELISMKDGAMAAQEQILSGQKIVNDTAEATSASIKSGIVVSGLKAEQAAATGVMAAKSAAAYASLPGIGIGLAASQIAAMQALISSATALSSIPGFKDGGVVSGLYKGGDRQLIRANAGEMILNSSQQSKLFSAINKGGFGGGEVVFEISGNKLVGILNQTKAKQSRI